MQKNWIGILAELLQLELATVDVYAPITLVNIDTAKKRGA
jgi:hypothetical protein